ncbi:hypothetical protein J4466_02190 [Candidatus Pacearchaeota archaeon]|nr:hypothetical protein [Candidatus Pacearchaeota archaeon]
MRKIRKENKKAVSEVVSYVLLIVVAISLSIIVYAWIKIQLPKEIIECPEGVSVIIKDYQCNEQNNIINITFQNKGFFSIDGTIIKISNKSNEAPTISAEHVGGIGINQNLENNGFIYFTPSLNPGLNLKANFSYGSFNQINKIQITPFVSSKKLGEKKLYVVLCNEKKIVQDIEKCA